MNEKKINLKRTDSLSSYNNEESYVIPLEAACSHEFSKGCIIVEDEANK